jgi:hypothetical protein
VQYDKLMTIVELYASNVPQAMAERHLEMARKQPKDATSRSGVAVRIIPLTGLF